MIKGHSAERWSFPFTSIYLFILVWTLELFFMQSEAIVIYWRLKLSHIWSVESLQAGSHLFIEFQLYWGLFLPSYFILKIYYIVFLD